MPSTVKKPKPLVFVRPASLQIVAALDEALRQGASVDIVPGSHFADRIAAIVKRARADGLL